MGRNAPSSVLGAQFPHLTPAKGAGTTSSLDMTKPMCDIRIQLKSFKRKGNTYIILSAEHTASYTRELYLAKAVRVCADGSISNHVSTLVMSVEDYESAPLWTFSHKTNL